MPKLVKKEETVPLEKLKDELKPERLSKMLEAKYGEALKGLAAAISGKARKMAKAKSDPDSLRKLAEEIENARYLEITITELRFVPRKIPKEYQEKINALLEKAAEMTPAETLREIADIAEEAEGKIRFTPIISAKPNEELIKELKDTMKDLVEDSVKIITAGLNGKVAEPFSISFDDEKTAELLFESLKGIGLEKPESEEKIAFKDAAIPKGKQPLEILLVGKKIEIRWPKWLAVGKSYLADIVPEKANRR